MATPRGAEHRDLEQRFRNLEQKIADLSTRVLMQRKAEVTQGDFVVSGGGSVVVDGTTTIALLSPDAVNIATRTADGSWTRPNMVLKPDGFVAADTSGQTAVFRVQDSDGAAVIAADSQIVWLPNTVHMGGTISHLDGAVVMPGLPTTGAGANVNWSLPDGALAVVTSTERHKDNIAPAKVDTEAVLSLREVSYTRKDDPDPEHPVTYLGFIAEQAEAAGLAAWVVYDDDGKPWSFDYTGFAAVAHHAVLRSLADRAGTLEAERDELAATVASLADRVAALEDRA